MYELLTLSRYVFNQQITMSPNKTIQLSQSGYQIYQKYQIQLQYHFFVVFYFYIIYVFDYLVLSVKEIAFIFQITK